MAEKVNKLPIKAINEDSKKYKEIVNIDFEEDGKSYRVKFTPYFETTKIQEVIRNIRDDLEDMYKSKAEFPDVLMPVFIVYHTLLVFSDFPRTKSKDIKARISYFKNTINTRYFTECTDYFIQEEMDKVFDAVDEVLKMSDKLEREMIKAQEKMKRLNLKNDEVKAMVQGKKKIIPEA